MQANVEFRAVAKKAGVRLWEVAEAIGITDGMLSRRLRRELPNVEREKLLLIVAEIAKRKEAEENEQNAEH